MSGVRFAMLVLGAAIFFAPWCGADVALIGAAQDNTLYEDANGGLSNGAGQHFFAGRTGTGAIRRGLILFDIAGNIPTGSTITSVILTLHMSQTQTGPQRIGLHAVLNAWGEGDSDAPGGEGGGAPARPGDATWLHTFFDTDFWDQPGGDFRAGASAFVTVDQIGSYTWGSTSGLVGDIQGWLDSPGSNFGWLLQGNEGGPSTTKRFDTRENPNPDFRPVLMVEFQPVPAPAGLATLALAAMGVRGRRRR